jgi:hypothetical protein
MIPAPARPGRPMIAAVVAVAALIGGAGVALAATSSSAPRTAARVGTAAAKPSPSPSVRCPVMRPWQRLAPFRRGLALPGGGFAGPGVVVPFGFGPLGAIHGQFVTAKPGGGYQTLDTQRGKVTAVSSGSITVKSSDGYSRTYQVTGSTNVNARRAGIGSVKTGQTVFVLATASGSSATASRIIDFAALPKPPRMVIPKPGTHRMPRLVPCARWHVSR